MNAVTMNRLLVGHNFVLFLISNIHCLEFGHRIHTWVSLLLCRAAVGRLNICNCCQVLGKVCNYIGEVLLDHWTYIIFDHYRPVQEAVIPIFDHLFLLLVRLGDDNPIVLQLLMLPC